MRAALEHWRRSLATVALTAAPFWVGPSFADLGLERRLPDETFIYGTCEPKPDQGCSPPLQIQNSTTCEDNVVAIDVAPRRVFRLRGDGVASSYGDAVRVSSGRRTVTVFARSVAEAGRAAQVLRRETESGPVALASPVYPRAVLAELKRVVVVRRGLPSATAVARALGIRRSHVRARLDTARLLPARALRRARVPRRSWARVETDRQVSFLAEELGIRAAMEDYDLTREEVRRAIRRVRGLTGTC